MVGMKDMDEVIVGEGSIVSPIGKMTISALNTHLKT
jgi:hypothetical protein